MEKKYTHFSVDYSNSSHNRALQREIKLARNIQTQLLNGHTSDVGTDNLIGISMPARLVGGDYFDFYKLSDQKIRVVIGDVMGKGIPAAMLMILTRGAFRSASESTKSPSETLTAMNNAIYDDLKQLKSFVTLFCCDWDLENNRLTYANAGHVYPFHISNHDISSLGDVNGIMLGGLPDQVYDESTVQLEYGDTIFFYTDGIVEAQNVDGEFYGKDRLINVLTEGFNRSVQEIEDNIILSLFEYTNGINQKDDITMVILQNDDSEAEIRGYNSPMMSQEEGEEQ
ncbi:serine phosphatase RsbU (regulator of sigma subunit) [Alkalibacillus flavidus]|uniref:Serine phosphatase RsbU (Regulator of sigma subunit) n=1 Tax=Alkalibacillus flavidus TaxID=546021 RepID=A0ABV2KW63_9BACI